MINTIDAYAHIGYPRYGTPDELAGIWRQWNIERGCVVLPPDMPDFEGLARIRSILADKVRLFGIPYGPDQTTRLELAEIQITFGITGMRLAPDEILENPEILKALGKAGLCLMAINVHEDAAITRIMIDWLEQYPRGTIASPHFLKAATISEAAGDAAAFSDLLRHPRMHAILSRHGMSSKQPYPHRDLKPWVEDILPLLTWDRVMWGSELPVVYHRDEQVDGVRSWLQELGVSMDQETEEKYLGGNAARLFFGSAEPEAGEVEFPPWVGQGLQRFINENQPVPVLRTKDLELPLDLHGRMMSEYMVRQKDYPDLEFRDFLVEILKTKIR